MEGKMNEGRSIEGRRIGRLQRGGVWG